MSRIERFEDLVVWRKARVLAVTIYRTTETFPKHELFGMTSQLRRAAVSMVANIAEGSSRRTSGAFANHLDIAIGSGAELRALLLIAEDIGYIEGSANRPLLDQANEVTKMLQSLHASIRHKINNDSDHSERK